MQRFGATFSQLKGLNVKQTNPMFSGGGGGSRRIDFNLCGQKYKKVQEICLFLGNALKVSMLQKCT